MSKSTATKWGKTKIILVTILAISAIAILTFVLTTDMRAYAKANKLELTGLYNEAIAIYETIPDYKDVQERVTKCNYQIALAFENECDYTKALAAFEALGEYSDAPTHVNECNYQLALALENNGNYADALAAFEALEEYLDAPAHVNKCNYQLALALENEGNYADALAAFEALGEYSDAPTHVNECNYQLALALENEGNYADALAAFEALGEYSDAPTHVNECNYQLALALENEGNYADALAAFEALGEYSDAPTHVNECNYQLALALENEGNYADALAAFEALEEYLDAPAHVNKCNYQLALVLENEGNYTDALAAFAALGEYSDAPAHANECNYQLALALESKGNYAEALTAFEALGEYSDAPTHVNECNYQIALNVEEKGNAAEAMALFASLGKYKDSADHAATIDAAIIQCNAEIERIAIQHSEYDAAVADASSTLAKGETPLDPTIITALNESLSAGSEIIIDVPKLPENLNDIISITQELSAIDYSDVTTSIVKNTADLKNSILQYNNVFAPSEEFVIDRLMRVPAVAYIDAATEDNDPNGLLGEPGGYTAQVYFSSTMVSSAYASMPNMDIIEAGTDCGGSIEVYATVEDAERRRTYLASFDGTIFSTGSHTVVGTLLVRTSDELSVSEQKELETAIINSLTSLNPDPIIQRVIVDNEDSLANSDAYLPSDSANKVVIASNSNLVSIAECGYSVENGWLYYSFIAHNNTDSAIELPEFRITTRDADGNLLSVENQILDILYPDQDIVWASLGGEVDAMPASIEVKLVDPEPYKLVNPTKLDHPEYIPLEVQGARLKTDRYFGSVIGEIYNPNDYAISGAAITIIFRDSSHKLLGGETNFSSNIGAGETIPFEFPVSSEISTDYYEVYASPWW